MSMSIYQVITVLLLTLLAVWLIAGAIRSLFRW